MGVEHHVDRRSVLRTAAVAGAAVAGVSATAGSGTGDGQPPRKLVVPDAAFFERGVVGQYVLVTDPTDRTRTTLPDCPFVDWPADRTRRYQGLVLDRLTDQPDATRVPVYADADRPTVTIGAPYVVEAATTCGSFLGLHVAAVATTAAGDRPAAGGTRG